MSRLDHTRPLSTNFVAPADQPPEDRYLTVAEAAKAAGLTIPQVWARINTGKLRAHRITLQPLPPPKNKRGQRPRAFIDLQDLEALIKPPAGLKGAGGDPTTGTGVTS